jgi:hypothetical protein
MSNKTPILKIEEPLSYNQEREKLIIVIESCISTEQIMVAEKYLNLWTTKYCKPDEYIDFLFKNKKMELNYGWNNKN